MTFDEHNTRQKTLTPALIAFTSTVLMTEFEKDLMSPAALWFNH